MPTLGILLTSLLSGKRYLPLKVWRVRRSRAALSRHLSGASPRSLTVWSCSSLPDPRGCRETAPGSQGDLVNTILVPSRGPHLGTQGFKQGFLLFLWRGVHNLSLRKDLVRPVHVLGSQDAGEPCTALPKANAPEGFERGSIRR